MCVCLCQLRAARDAAGLARRDGRGTALGALALRVARRVSEAAVGVVALAADVAAATEQEQTTLAPRLRERDRRGGGGGGTRSSPVVAGATQRDGRVLLLHMRSDAPPPMRSAMLSRGGSSTWPRLSTRAPQQPRTPHTELHDANVSKCVQFEVSGTLISDGWIVMSSRFCASEQSVASQRQAFRTTCARDASTNEHEYMSTDTRQGDSHHGNGQDEDSGENGENPHLNRLEGEVQRLPRRGRCHGTCRPVSCLWSYATKWHSSAAVTTVGDTTHD